MLQLLERVSRISHFRLKVSFSSLISVPPTGRDIQLSRNSTKVHATMPIGIMGSNSLALLGWGSRCLARGKETAWIHFFVLLPCLTPKYLALQSIKCKTIVTHNTNRHCRVRSIVRPLSKQLYTVMLLQGQPWFYSVCNVTGCFQYFILSQFTQLAYF